MNFFAYPTAAERYASGRPFFHPLAIKKIQAVCCAHGLVRRALDVGCGTGQSTLALLELAEEIVGLDSSREMLSHAIRHERIRYVEGCAEKMPFTDAEFDLVTAGLAFHWFDREKFLAEAQRVLLPEAWLIIYNDVFTGEMNGNESFQKWHREEYLARYPSPPRNVRSMSELNAAEYGVRPFAAEDFTHEIEFSTEQLVAYLITQTNVISAVEAGKENLQPVANWLRECISPVFSAVSESFSFRCQIQFLKKS